MVRDRSAWSRAPARAGASLLWVAKTETPMWKLINLLGRLVADEQGGEVLEYALIAGLIIVAAIAAITAVGNKVLARWTSLQNSM